MTEFTYIFNNDQIEEIKKMRQEGKFIRAIADKFGCKSITPVYNLCKKEGISTKNKLFFTKEEGDKIKSLYAEGKSCREISEIIHGVSSGVRNWLRKNGIEKHDFKHNWRKYELNEKFFEKIDSNDKAYILGLIYADGCNVCNPEKGESHLEIGLKEEDRYLLEKINEIFSSNRPLTKGRYKTIHGEKYIYKLLLNSPKICEDLINLGVMPRKSLILKFPTEEQVPRYLINHFLRGYFDGDGSISKRGNREYYRINILGTESFIKDMAGLLNKELNFTHYKIFNHCNNNITKAFEIERASDVLKFCDFIYKDADLLMKRKYEKYLIFKKYREGYDSFKNNKIIDGKEYKKCTCCFEYKELNDFSDNSSHREGKASQCKSCLYIKHYKPKKEENIKKWEILKNVMDNRQSMQFAN